MNKKSPLQSRKNRKNGDASPASAAQKKPPREYVDFFDRFIGGKAALLTVIVIAAISVFAFYNFLTFNFLYIFKGIASDSYNESLPFLTHISNYLRTDGIPRWSFNTGLGQNIFPGALNSPFNFLLVLLPARIIPYGIIYVEVLKFLLAGLIFYGYLRTLSLTRYSAFLGSLLFAFCGFMVIGSRWYNYSTIVVYVSFLFLSFEQLYKKNNYLYFPIAIALLSYSIFSLYCYGLFLLLYSVIRYFDEYEWNFKRFSFLYLKIAGLGFAGLAIGFTCFYSGVMQMIQSPRVSGGVGYGNTLKNVPVFGLENFWTERLSFGIPHQHIKTAILRLFASDILGKGVNYKGWHNDLEAPLFNCGELILLLVPLVFASIERRRRFLYGAFLGLWVLIVIFPFFRYAYDLFTGEYYKTGISLIVTMVMLFYGLRALDIIDRTSKLKWYLLVPTYLGLMALLYSVHYPYHPEIIQEDVRDRVALYLTVYAGLLYLMSVPFLKNGARIVLLGVVIFEIASYAQPSPTPRFTMTPREFIEDKTGYNDYTNEAIAYLKSIDKSFYRVTKTYFSGSAIHTSFNDAQFQDYYGTRSYSSFNQLNYVKFLSETGIIRDSEETDTRWIVGLKERPVLQALTSVKYNLTKWAPTGFYRVGFDSIAQFGDVIVERNNYFLPFGVAYDLYMSHSAFLKASITMRRITLLNVFIGDDKDSAAYAGFPQFSLSDTGVNYVSDLVQGYSSGISELTQDVRDIKKDTLALQIHKQNYFKGTIHVEGKRMLFFSIPFDKGWRAKVDGMRTRLMRINIGFTGVPLEKGDHTVEIMFEPPHLKPVLGVTIAGLLAYCVLIVLHVRRKRILKQAAASGEPQKV